LTKWQIDRKACAFFSIIYLNFFLVHSLKLYFSYSNGKSASSYPARSRSHSPLRRCPSHALHLLIARCSPSVMICCSLRSFTWFQSGVADWAVHSFFNRSKPLFQTRPHRFTSSLAVFIGPRLAPAKEGSLPHSSSG
jgi:hypothetical protein